MKRQHQQDFEKAIDSIIEGNPARTIIANVTPGGGKSALPIIAGKLLGAGLADKILWICPRMALQSQGERNFIDPFFRSMFTHNLQIRASTNEADPCRGNQGFITTYQAVAADQYKTILQDVHRHRYIVVLDEFHHLELNGEWHQALHPIMKAAEFKILMTGTLQRGDEAKIAYVDYTQEFYGHRPKLVSDDNQIVINYTRRQALQDKAIIPIHFVFSDGRASWQNSKGVLTTIDRFSHVLPKEKGAALYAALNTQFAEHLLSLTLNHFVRYQETVPSAKALIVTAEIGQARKHFKKLTDLNHAVGLATSHDSQLAVANIERFKRGSLNILVTIAMAYEGLDVPEVSHIACLTHIRTKPWIEQMFARAVRINRSAGAWEDQVAYVFVPDDVVMRSIVEEIDREQIGCVKDGRARSRILVPEMEPGAGIPRVTPLGSEATNQREKTLDDTPRTPKEEETHYLRLIEGHIRRFAFNNRMSPKDINFELVKEFGKGRRSMRLSELKKLYGFVRRHYSLGKIRGTGRQRLPTKPEFVQSKLFNTDFMKGFEY